MCAKGKKNSEIIAFLEQNKVYTPSYYYYMRTGKKIVALNEDFPYTWSNRTISDILENVVYIGHTLSLQTEVISYKVKKRLKNPAEKQVFTPNTHELIIDRNTWEIVQQIRSSRRRPTKSGYKSIFAGLIFCADCGSKLTMRTSKTKSGESHYFICSNYRKKKGDPCTIHTISEEVLYSQTLLSIQNMTSFAEDSESEFRTQITQATESETKKAMSASMKKLNKATSRLDKIRKIIRKLYEDNVSGKVSDADYKSMSEDFAAERKSLEAEITALQSEIKALKSKASGADGFIRLAKKYADITELDTEILNTFVEKIVVHERVKTDGGFTQQIEFVFKGIGKVDLGRN